MSIRHARGCSAPQVIRQPLIPNQATRDPCSTNANRTRSESPHRPLPGESPRRNRHALLILMPKVLQKLARMRIPGPTQWPGKQSPAIPRRSRTARRSRANSEERRRGHRKTPPASEYAPYSAHACHSVHPNPRSASQIRAAEKRWTP